MQEAEREVPVERTGQVDEGMVPAPVERGQVIEQPPELGRPAGMLQKRDIAELKEQIALWKEFKLGLLSVTTSEDWVDQEGDPYLLDSGIHKVAQVTHLMFGEPAITREDGEDGRGRWTSFTCRLGAACRGRRTADVGYSSTRDPFFAIKWEGKGESRVKTDVAYEQINIGNVLKKSVTNAQHRVLMKLLAFGGLTWKELEKFDIVPKDSIRRGKGAQDQKRATGSGGWTPAKSRLWGILLELEGGSEEAAGKHLFRITENKEKGYQGKSDPQILTDNQAGYVLKVVETEFEKLYGAPAPKNVGPGGIQPGAAPAGNQAREPGAEG